MDASTKLAETELEVKKLSEQIDDLESKLDAMDVNDSGACARLQQRLEKLYKREEAATKFRQSLLDVVLEEKKAISQSRTPELQVVSPSDTLSRPPAYYEDAPEDEHNNPATALDIPIPVATSAPSTTPQSEKATLQTSAALIDPNDGQHRDYDTAPWTVFMSYCWVNSNEAKELGQVPHDSACGPADPRAIARSLTKDGFTTWLDVDRLEAGPSLQEQLVLGIVPAKLAILCFSAGYLASKNCQREFKFIQQLGLPFVLVLVGKEKVAFEKTAFGFYVADTLYIDCTRSYDYLKIVDAVSEHFTADPASAKPTLCPSASSTAGSQNPFQILADRAAAGDAEAQFRLATLYDTQSPYGRSARNPYSPPANDATAADWYTRAAKQGHVKASANLGSMYEIGRGVKKDKKKAAKYLARGGYGGKGGTDFSTMSDIFQAGAGILNAFTGR
ncbi:hypothetical protein HK097_009376 [Rhizophlyctis rosea]|uniref:TIR domain-containing protein n=1 Tax=Rhizophlyctis rosea TaxID=64517 RepID=A0AAD5S909_9FUNG|nr:hypothetical protein HK097_009376 [Rhizophlyctis rosea]